MTLDSIISRSELSATAQSTITATAPNAGFARYGQLDLFTRELPRRPWCSNNLHDEGLAVLPLRQALEKKYIQYNPPAMIHWLAFDIDRKFSTPADEWITAAVPNIVVRNPRNQHVHLLYGMVAGVCKTEAARQAPQRLVEAIYEGYRHALQADSGFTQLICKNPLSSAWCTEVLREDLYELSELSEYVDLKAASARIKATPKQHRSGIGRNCSLFDSLRGWSYRWMRDYQQLGRDVWMQRVLEQCEKLNCFDSPLPYSEVRSIAKSVGKWTWDRYTGRSGRTTTENDLAVEGLTPETFSMLQSNLGKRGNDKRWGNNAEKKAEAVKMRAGGMKQAEIAKELGVDQGSVSRWLKVIKK